MKRKILVTGGSGFVGSFLIQELLRDESNTIIAMYNSSQAPDTYEEPASKLRWIKADIVKDDLTNLVSGVDTVYHLAGYSSLSSSSSEVDRLNAVNVKGTRRVAEACTSAQVKQLIFVSSIAACEVSTELVIDEINGYPVTEYGLSKKRAEELLIEGSINSYELTILRPTALFGENHGGSVLELAKKIQEHRFLIFGSGESKTNFLYIRDFIDMLLLVKDDQRAYGQVFIASDIPLHLSTFVKYIVEALGSDLRIMKVNVAVGYITALIFDIVSFVLQKPLPLSRRRLRAMLSRTSYTNRKLKSVMGTNCKYGVKKGLLTSISYYRQQGML
tara:strand:+ start:1558 stop:2550 length:993 start_codon:yes stop_codon:yes gene_type:complete